VALNNSLPPCGLWEITATDYIERESCGILLAILHLNFYVWSFCIFHHRTWQLHLHQLSLVSSLFIIGSRFSSHAFAPPQLSASAKALFPSLHALKRSSLVVFIKSIRDLLLYNFSISLLWASSGNTSCTCCLITVPRWILQILLHNLWVPSCNFYSPDFSYSLLMFDSSSSSHNICPSQNRVSIFILLLYFSSIIKVFINSTLQEISHWIQPFWRNHHSIRSLNKQNPIVPLCRHPTNLQPFHYKLLYIQK